MGLFGWLKGGSGRVGKDEQASAAASGPAVDPSRHGVELVAAGRYAEAVEAFRAAAASEPQVAAHQVNLAFALQESGDQEAAIRHLKRAIDLDDASFDARYMLAGALEQGGDLDGAKRSLMRAVELQPGMEQARSDLCRVLSQAGDNEGARSVIDVALRQFPGSAHLLIASGNLFLAEGKAEAALAAFDEALNSLPDDLNILLNRALALQAAGRFEDSLAEYLLVLAAHPSSSRAHAEQAGALKSLGRHDEAAAAYRRALALQPDEAEWLNQLGAVLQRSGLAQEALACYRESIRLRPDLPGAYANYGFALADVGKIPEAVVEYRKGLALKPIAELHDNLAIALQKMGVIDEAIHHYGEALRLRPDNLVTRTNLAAALSDAGDPGRAIEEYRKILEIDHEQISTHSCLLFSLSIHEATTIESYLEEAARYDAKISPKSVPYLGPRARAAGSPLRIGFVSGDLRNHPVGFFLEGLVSNLDRRRFELIAYPTAVHEDVLTKRIRPKFATWRPLKGLNTAQAVAAIRGDQVDVLFDLAGHTGDNRPTVFAARAAPVQIAWLGFFASTGISAMDFILADDVCVPAGMEHQFTEKVWRLPQTRLCFTPPAAGTTPDVGELPSLKKGHVTFGCLQRFQKITDAVIELWGEIFAAIPSARLLLQSHQTGRQIYVDQMLSRLELVGIARERVTARPPAAREEYLQTYGEVDIILDTFPFNGGTTTCEALWMGVPTLTLEGETMLARQGMAMMMAAGLGDWVAHAPADYVARAIARASDLHALAALRATLRSAVQETPLFDVKLFAHRFSTAVEAIHATQRATAEA